MWRRWIGSPGGPIIRHGDLWPSNVIFRDGVPVALIDWEFAQPGTVLDDIASGAKQWVPLLSDRQAEDNGWALPVDRPRRLRLFCDAYGMSELDRSKVLPTVLVNSEYGYRSQRTWGEAGVPGFAEMWKAGSGTRILADRASLEANLDALQDAFLSGSWAEGGSRSNGSLMPVVPELPKPGPSSSTRQVSPSTLGASNRSAPDRRVWVAPYGREDSPLMRSQPPARIDRWQSWEVLLETSPHCSDLNEGVCLIS